MLKKTDPKNVVVIRTDRIGEVLLSTVAVDAIRSKYPEARISFVTSGYSRPLVEERGDIDEVMTADTSGRRGCITEALRLSLVLRKRRFDAAVVLNPHKTLHLACFLAGIPLRAGFDRKWGLFLNRKIKDERDKGLKHEVEYTLDLLRELGIRTIVSGPKLYPGDRAEAAVNRLMAERGVTEDRPLVAVHPGSSNPAKVWPGERYTELISRIAKKTNSRVVVLGSAEEAELAGKVAEGAGACVLNLAGKLDLKELAALLKRSTLFIGNDAGPMHMAAALGVPVIAIFGRNIPGVSPRRWRPRGDNHVVFHEDPGCEKCFDADCPHDRRCLRAVTVDAVFVVAKRMLEESKNSR